MDIQTITAMLLPNNKQNDAPLGSQTIAGQWQSDITTSFTAPFGSNYSFVGTTSPYTGGPATAFNQWVTQFYTYNDRMPAYWNVAWLNPPSYCHDPNPPYGPLPNPWVQLKDFEPTISSTDPATQEYCFLNTPLNLGYVPSNVSPQVVLDDAIPSTIQIAAFDPILAASSITNLHVFATDLSNPANVTAISVGPNGSSAVFPYPRQANGSPLPAGPYLTTITTDPSGSPQTTNGMEPFYIAHDDTSYPSAFGVAVAAPQVVITDTGAADIYGDGTCAGTQYTNTNTLGGNFVPLVTLPTRGQVAFGSSSNTIYVGTRPTVVVLYDDQGQSTSYNVGQCESETVTVSGAQAALVVNTGSNSVSIVNLGIYSSVSLQSTIAVGNQPVAAAINPAETMAYVANYADGTISEVDLTALHQTRTIPVMSHPATLAFDSNGNLWVGGQGAVMNVNVGGWFVASSSPVDGTVNGMSYDTQKGVLVQTMLQNGNVATVAAGGTGGEGTTGSNPVSFSSTPGQSYSTQNTFSVATLSSSTSTSAVVMGDNAPYAQSSIAPYLAFPGQTAFTPPIYSATTGDITATVNGTSFTVSLVGTGQILIQGTLPYPARGVALTPSMVYFTMPESNSLVSLPLQLP